MALQLHDTAPDFEAETTEGRIGFHDWLGTSWGILFSHPKDFTPVCTTELGAMAGLKSEFDRRNVKILGLSVDPVTDHTKWSQDIKDVTGHAVNYPLVGDSELKVAKLYGMLPADAWRQLGRSHGGNKPHSPQRLRHRPRQEDPASPHLSDGDRAQFPGNPARDRFAAIDRPP